MNVGFIGLGQMGSNMARNLIKTGHTLTVYNRTPGRADELRALGTSVAETPGEASAHAEAVITMLADDHALESMVWGPDGVLQSLSAGAIHIGMSTISIALSKRLHASHGQKQQHYIAAPVFGRPEAAAAAKLFVVAAGEADQIARCQPLFDAMGQRTFTVGQKPAAANAVKLAGNFLITVVIESLAESCALVKKAGVEPDAFLDVLTSSLFNCPVYKTYGAMVARQKFEPVGFKLPLGFKDNRLVLEAAEDLAVPLPLASVVHDRFVAAIAQGLSDSDWSAIASLAYRSAGI